MTKQSAPFLVAALLSTTILGGAFLIAPPLECATVVCAERDIPKQANQGRAGRETDTESTAKTATANSPQQHAAQANNRTDDRQEAGRNRSVWNVTITDIIIAIATAISAGVGVAILCVYRGQRDIMRHQLKAAVVAADASRKASQNAAAQTELARQEFVLVHRARLVAGNIEPGGDHTHEAHLFRATIELTNNGALEAKISRSEFAVTINSDNLHVMDEFRSETPEIGRSIVGRIIEGGTTHTINYECPELTWEDINHRLGVRDNMREIYFLGKITYLIDRRTAEREVGFRRRLDRSGSHFHRIENEEKEHST